MLKLFKKWKLKRLQARKVKIFRAKNKKEFEAVKDKFVSLNDTDSIHYSGPCLDIDHGSDNGDSE